MLKKIFYIFILFAVSVPFLPMAKAAPNGLGVSPVVVDEKGEPRQIIKKSLVLANASGRYQDVYTFVNNISAEQGTQEFIQPSDADFSDSLANWINISRAMYHMAPGEKKTIDYEIKINLTAKPGKYHAIISFAEGFNRDDASARLLEAATVTVNLEVPENIKEEAQLLKFLPQKNYFFNAPINFYFEVENIGNRNILPTGEIIVYNKDGKEVANTQANPQKVSVEPDQIIRYNVKFAKLGGFGRYKAVLSLNYGGTQRGQLQDIVYFWVLPWPLLLFGGVSLLAIFILIYLYLETWRKPKNFSAPTQSTVIKIVKPSATAKLKQTEAEEVKKKTRYV